MVDARGYSCPMPVIMVQKAVKGQNPGQLEVLVDRLAEKIKEEDVHVNFALNTIPLYILKLC